jgi:8-oxo-dGTP diphosphatase
MKNQPSVGVAIIIFKDGKILLGEDLTKGGEPLYGVPGGHWETNETLSEAVKREVLEEAGIEIQNLKLISVYDFFRPDKNKRYVTIGFKADYKSGKLKDESRHTRKNWGWFATDNLPSSIFPPDKILIERSKTGIIWEEK